MNRVKPKILLIGPYPPPYGGIAIVVRDLLDSSLSKSYDLRLLKTRPPGQNEIYRFLYDLISLIKEFIRFSPSIVHIHTSYDYGWIKHISYCLVSKLFNKKVVLHHHGIPEDSNYEYGGKMNFVYPPKMGLFFTDHIICISDNIKDKVGKVTNIKKITTIKNGVNKEILKIGKNRERFYTNVNIELLYMGAISERKGIMELLNIIKKIVSSFCGYKINPAIIGSGPLDEYVDEFISKNNLENKIFRKKIINEEEKIKILSENDIFILQSDHEGLPIAILESMASGSLVITCPVGGIPEVIKDKKNGLLITPHNEEELLSALKWILNNLEDTERMRKNNIVLIDNEYSWEKNSKKIGELYNRLCS